MGLNLDIRHPLDGFTQKLARANTHLDAVEQALEGLLDPEPDLIPGEFEPNGSAYIFRAQRDAIDTTAVSTAVGDCVHNLRAALDYLVWELVAIAGNQGTTHTEFPIFTDPTEYRKAAPKKIRGVPPRAEAIFERLQPFYGPNSDPFSPHWRDPDTEPLALLYDLDKWDKHRSLNLTEDVLSMSLVGFDQLRIHTAPTPAKLPGRFKRGAILAAAHIGSQRPQVDVHLHVSYDIAFERDGPAGGEPVVQTLKHIRQEVRGRVLPAFAKFFPAL